MLLFCFHELFLFFFTLAPFTAEGQVDLIKHVYEYTTLSLFL